MVVDQAAREVVARICLAAMENSPRHRQNRNCVCAAVLRGITRYCHYVALLPLRHETADLAIPTAPENEQTDHVSKHVLARVPNLAKLIVRKDALSSRCWVATAPASQPY